MVHLVGSVDRELNFNILWTLAHKVGIFVTEDIDLEGIVACYL